MRVAQNKAAIPLLFSLALVTALWLAHPAREKAIPEPPILTLYCSAALQHPVAEIVETFQRRAGIRIVVQYEIEPPCPNHGTVKSHPDLLIAEDPDWIDRANACGGLIQIRTIAWFAPAIQVAAGNPLGIRTLSDLLSPGLRLAVSDPGTVLGRITPTLFQEQDIGWDTVKGQIVVTAASASDLAGAVTRGRADAAILWYPVAQHYPLTTVVEIPDPGTFRVPISAALLHTARYPEEGRDFLAFATGPAARELLERHRYDVE